MKKILMLASMLLLLLLAYSCEDSLGLDPEVVVEEVGNGSGIDTRFKPKNIAWQKISEYYYTTITPNPVIHDVFRIVDEDILIDTSNVDTLIWLDFTLQSTQGDILYARYKEKFISFRIKTDTLRVNEATFTENSILIKDLYIKELSSERIYSIPAKDINAQIIFSESADRQISCLIKMDFVDTVKYSLFKSVTAKILIEL